MVRSTKSMAAAIVAAVVIGGASIATASVRPSSESGKEAAKARSELISPFLQPYSSLSKPVRYVSEGMKPGSVRYGPCLLRPHTIHFRNSLSREAVGVKPTTECNQGKSVEFVKHSTELHFLWFTVAPQAGKTFIEKSKSTQRAITFFESVKVAVRCDNYEETLWMGTTVGEIRYQGRTYRARVYHSPIKLDCGFDWP